MAFSSSKSQYGYPYALPTVLFAPLPILTRPTDSRTMAPAMSKIAKTEAPRTPDEEDLQDYPGYISDSFVIDPNDVFSSPEPEAQPDSDPAAQKDDGTAVTTGEDERAASTGKRSSFHWDTDADIIFAFTIFDHCRLTPEIVTALKANLDARGYSFSSDQIKYVFLGWLCTSFFQWLIRGSFETSSEPWRSNQAYHRKSTHS